MWLNQLVYSERSHNGRTSGPSGRGLLSVDLELLSRTFRVLSFRTDSSRTQNLDFSGSLKDKFPSECMFLRRLFGLLDSWRSSRLELKDMENFWLGIDSITKRLREYITFLLSPLRLLGGIGVDCHSGSKLEGLCFARFCGPKLWSQLFRVPISAGLLAG